MSESDPNVSVSAAIPWYRSAVFQGILAAVVVQGLSRSQLASILTTSAALVLCKGTTWTTH